jgi:two-component system response regulator YesN
MTQAPPRPHILVLDDDPAIRDALEMALRGLYVVHSAATGEQAYAILQRHPIAAIVLDAVLGAEHGLDLIQRFRAISRAPIVLVTGYGSEELAVRALRARVDEYLNKPVDVAKLRTTLADLMTLPGARADHVIRARRHLEEHPDQRHTTASLAKELGLSERHLRRRFQEAYGKTPRRFLAEVRMQRAEELLRKTQLGIEEIALAVGYPDLGTFRRIFKHAFGMTPSDFRSPPPHTAASRG